MDKTELAIDFWRRFMSLAGDTPQPDHPDVVALIALMDKARQRLGEELHAASYESRMGVRVVEEEDYRRICGLDTK